MGDRLDTSLEDISGNSLNEQRRFRSNLLLIVAVYSRPPWSVAALAPMPATVGSTSPIANSSRRKDAARKASAEAGRRQIGAALSSAAAVLSSGAAALCPCRAVGPATDSSYTACRTQAAHGGSVSVPSEDIPHEPPCESTASEAVELQLSAARQIWLITIRSSAWR